jgi:flagellar biosynthesis component FlhA
MIRANNSVDNTSLIRQLKHSSLIWKDVTTIIRLKEGKEWKDVETECIQQADFLYTNYTMIFNRLLRDRLDVSILYTFLEVLKEIEDGKLDQHEAAYQIGMLLKKMYIDPKLEELKEPVYTKGRPLSWQDFKKIKIR